jgi:septum formation protein
VTLVLASASPRRRDILAAAGFEFSVRPAAVDEVAEGRPAEVAVENARAKALAVARPGEVVLGADTVVALDGRLWPKPADAAVAEATLRALSGRTHEVVSGFAVVRDGELAAGHELTRVTFRSLDEAALTWYLGTGEWHDRAGAYAIQGHGAILIGRIEGDYLNVIGLPVVALDALG